MQWARCAATQCKKYEMNGFLLVCFCRFATLRRERDLLVAVAVGAGEGVHEVAEGLVVGDEAEGDHVGELHGVAGRVVGEGGGAADDVLAAVDVEVLPDGPDTVDHAVVDEEDGVVGAGVEVLELGGATTEPVAATVHTHGVVVVTVALHELLEVLDIDHVEEQLGDVLVRVEAGADLVVEVTRQAAAVVVEVTLNVVVRRADGAKVGNKVAEGAVLHTATASARVQVDAHSSEVNAVPVGNVLSVATHGELVAVEDLTLVSLASVLSPVPVRHVTSVAAQVPEVLLHGVDEETVPCEEVGSHVNLSGVVDVGSDELVVASENTRVVGLLSVGHAGIRHVLKARHGIGERLALLLGHVPPLLTDIGVLVGAGGVLARVDVVPLVGVGLVANIPEGLARGNVLGRPVGDGRRLGGNDARDGGHAGESRNEMHYCKCCAVPRKKTMIS